MLYSDDLQTVPAGGTLTLPLSALNSPTGSIALSGSDGLSLAPGQYLLTFVSDATITEAGSIGAALALDGTALPYAQAALSSTGPDGDRIALSAIVSPTAASTLTVINNADNALSYENSTLTAVKLA